MNQRAENRRWAAFWVALLASIVASWASVGHAQDPKVVRKSVSQPMDAYDKVTGETLVEDITVNAVVPLAEEDSNAEVGFRPGRRSSARLELRLGDKPIRVDLDMACPEITSREVSQAYLAVKAFEDGGRGADIEAVRYAVEVLLNEGGCEITSSVSSRWRPQEADPR